MIVLVVAFAGLWSGPAFVAPTRSPALPPRSSWLVLGPCSAGCPGASAVVQQHGMLALAAAVVAAAVATNCAALRRLQARRTALAASCGGSDSRGRRDVLLSSASGFGVASITLATRPAGAAAKVSPEAVAKSKGDIDKLVKADPNKGPTLVRLAWHSSGTYDKMSKTGGSGLGTIRFKEELAHGGNAGLDKAVAWLEPVKQANPSLSYADLYTLSGVVAIKSLGGPDIPWRAGRVDSMDPKDVTPDGRLPNADNGSYAQDSAHLRDIFYRMGFNDQEIVALSGAHALGRCHADASGFVGPWTPTPTMFNNVYFSLLKNTEWEEGCIKGESCKNHQYRDSNSQQFMMLPTDIVLIKDPSFKQYVDLYASDQSKFFQDFSKAFGTLLELGTKDLYAV